MPEEYLQAAFEIKASCDEISRRILRWHWESKPGPHSFDALLDRIRQRQEESPAYYGHMPDVARKTSWQQLDTTLCMRVLLDPESDAAQPLDLLGNTAHPGAARQPRPAQRPAQRGGQKGKADLQHRAHLKGEKPVDDDCRAGQKPRHHKAAGPAKFGQAVHKLDFQGKTHTKIPPSNVRCRTIERGPVSRVQKSAERPFTDLPRALQLCSSGMQSRHRGPKGPSSAPQLPVGSALDALAFTLQGPLYRLPQSFTIPAGKEI